MKPYLLGMALVSAVHHLFSLHVLSKVSFLVEDVDFTLLGVFNPMANIFFVAVHVMDDDIVEGQESFEMSLMLSGSSFDLVNTGPFEITIEDNSCEFEE